jgi:recombinational DNA repair protein (RecF pathway)
LGALIRYLAKALKESGYSLHVDGRCECGNEIEGRTFFDYRSGAFFCEKCFDGVGREINNKTLKALIKVMAGEAEEYQNKVKVIKLLDYYIENRVEESLSSLKELIKIL